MLKGDLGVLVMNDDSFTHRIIPCTIGSQAKLQVHMYRPEQPPETDPIVLVHGIQSSSQIFDVPCAADCSLARFLCSAGYLVVTFDHRGAGGSWVKSWDFGLKHLALVDLPVVIKHALNESGSNQVTLAGHSLGGTTGYLLRAYLKKSGGSLCGITKDHLGKTFTIASPMRLSPELFPFSNINQKREQLRKLFEKDQNGIISLERFIQGQMMILNSVLGRLAAPGLIRKLLEWSAWSPRFANLIRRLRPRALFYDPNDFDARTFYALTTSRAMGSGSSRLMLELMDFIKAGGAIRVKHKDIKVDLFDDLKSMKGFRPLVISSSSDRLVPRLDATALYEPTEKKHMIITDRDYGIQCGHVGYLFKPGLYRLVRDDILRFLRGEELSSSGRKGSQ
jgi:pimeloyl-ACP methyl ester carboxylesterase